MSCDITLVVLASTKPNTLKVVEKSSERRQSAQSGFRSRITLRMQSEVVELYASGLSALAVSEQLHIGKTTVLKILKQQGTVVRPQGRRLS